MKRCPQCNRVESDNALTYCRTDGVALINDSGSFDSQTANFGSGSIPSEIETSLLIAGMAIGWGAGRTYL